MASHLRASSRALRSLSSAPRVLPATVRLASSRVPPPPSDPPSSSDAPATPPTSKTPKPLPSPSLTAQHLDALVPNLDVSTDEAPRERTGARGAGGKRSMSSIEKRRQAQSRVMLALAAAGVVGGVVWLGREWEGEGEKKALEGAEAEGWWDRAKKRFFNYSDYFNKPAWTELLPPLMPPPHQRPYTLLIDLEDLLVHSEWSREHGWRTAKRPGVDYFLAYLSQFYEIVLFTSQPAYTAAPVVEKLDPYNVYIPYKLFREATRFKDGKIVKDLSYLNRDLAKVVMLDTNAEHAALQPENAIVLKPWEGTPGDKELLGMVPFLEAIALYNLADVRPYIKAFEGKHIPTEYARLEAAEKRRLVEQWEEEQKRNPRKGKIGMNLGSMFGVSNAQTGRVPVAGGAAPADGPPETYIEARRREAQQAYLEEQKYWRDNADAIRRMMDEDREKQLKEMKGNLFGMIGLGAGGPPAGQQTPPGGQ